jgi:hypothetical protein
MGRTEPGESFHVRVDMFRSAIGYAVFLLTLAGYGGVQAATIHKWVDERGVTHYSDKAPADPEASVTRLDISTGERDRTAPAASSDHYYSIANQWQRMNQERLQRQQLELQRAALAVERRAAPQPTIDKSESRTRYVVAYPYRYNRFHRRHRHHGKTPRHQPSRRNLGSFPAPN